MAPTVSVFEFLTGLVRKDGRHGQRWAASDSFC
jgi:hypothetical protein